MKRYYRNRSLTSVTSNPFGSPALEEAIMSMNYRILICIGILLIDLFVFYLPLTALFLIYILLANPPWFREFLQQINQAEPKK
jgi:hypothetical protein